MSAYHAAKREGTHSKKNQLEMQLLSPEVAIALAGIREAAKEGLLALCIQVGLETMSTLFEAEMTEKVGPKGQHNPNRQAMRHGYDDGQVVLGGRKISVRRPRARTQDGQEVDLESYRHFQDEDILARAAFERMLHGLSTRRYVKGLEEIGEAVVARGTSKSAISNRFKQITEKALQQLLSMPLNNMDIVVLYIDGIVVAEHTVLVALGVDMQGTKHLLGLWEGATENATVCRELLSSLVERGLEVNKGMLVVIDGSKALRRAVTEVFGDQALIQRCQVHKLRNVLEHLPKEQHAFIKRKLTAAWSEVDASKAEASLQSLAKSLEERYPGAAASLREGLQETLTVNRLMVSAVLRRTVRSTNPIESANEVVKTTARRVKQWRTGKQVLRWVAAGLTEAEKRFRKVKGYRELPQLRASILTLICNEETNKALSA